MSSNFSFYEYKYNKGILKAEWGKLPSNFNGVFVKVCFSHSNKVEAAIHGIKMKNRMENFFKGYSIFSQNFKTHHHRWVVVHAVDFNSAVPRDFADKGYLLEKVACAYKISR